jgi:hypothetical protein
VLYDEAILGEREFRQRNMTIVGGGQSLCIVVFVPSKLWKKSKPARALADAVVKSVEFK